MSFFIPSHENICRRSSYIFVPPGWIEYEDSWAYDKIFCFRSAWLGMQILPLKRRVPYWSFEKSDDLVRFRSFASPGWALRISSSRVGVIIRILARPASTMTRLSWAISFWSSGGTDFSMTFRLTGFRLSAWQPRWPYVGGNLFQDHNPWLTQATFVDGDLNPVE